MPFFLSTPLLQPLPESGVQCVGLLILASRLLLVPDLFGSNVCIACHAGLKSGDDIENSPDDANEFDDMEFIDSHYLAAGGIIFTAIGYQFKLTADPDLDYDKCFGNKIIGSGCIGFC